MIADSPANKMKEGATEEDIGHVERLYPVPGDDDKKGLKKVDQQS